MAFYDLFPFEDVPKGSRVLIYGAGHVGQVYRMQLELTGYGTFVGFVDRNHAFLQGGRYPVYAPEEIPSLVFDEVVIAINSSQAAAEIRQMLLEEGVASSQIVDAKLRVAEEPSPPYVRVEGFVRRPGSVAILLTGGIGDCICQKKAVEALISLCPQIHIDLYYRVYDNGEFLRFLYQDTRQVENIYDAMTANRYEMRKDAYGLAFGLPGPWGAQFGAFHPECFEEFPAFRQQMEHFVAVARRHEPGVHPYAVYWQRNVFCGRDCYTVYAEDGALPIHDRAVQIPCSAAGRAAFRELGFRRYITLNVGNGRKKGNANVDMHIAKSWFLEAYEAFIRLFHAAHPDIEVVQLGSKACPELSSADQVLLGRPFDEVTEILHHAIFHLDIEGGLVHLATQVKTKCIVLFGPTPVEYYGYQENINLRAGTCHGCYCLYSDSDCCARGLARPECMASITPAMVMEAAEDILCETTLA